MPRKTSPPRTVDARTNSGRRPEFELFPGPMRELESLIRLIRAATIYLRRAPELLDSLSHLSAGDHALVREDFVESLGQEHIVDRNLLN